MKFTRLTALALALVMALSLVTVAQADDKPSTWISDELVEIRIMRDENPNQPIKLDTIKLQTIEELLNVRLIVEAPPKASYSDKKSVLIATDDMPDIMYVDFADVRSYARDDMFVNLSEYKDQMPNLFGLLEGNEALSMYTIDGSFYSAPTLYRANPDAARSGPLVNFRMDLLEKYGLAVPTTWDELYEVMLAIKEKEPDLIGMTNRKAGNTTATRKLLDCMAYPLGSNSTMYRDEDLGGQWIYGPTHENFKEVLSYLNKLYAAGLLDPDYSTMTKDLWTEKMSSGQAMCTVDNDGVVRNFNVALQTINADWNIGVVPTLTNALGQTRNTYYAENRPENAWVISASSDKIDVAVKFLDWCYSEQGTDVNNLGKEGVTYDVVDGKKVFKEEILAQYAANGANAIYDMSSALGIGLLEVTPRYDTSPDQQMALYLKGSDEARAAYREQLQTILNDAGLRDVASVTTAPPLTAEQTERYNELLVAVENIIWQEVDKYITGQEPIENWDKVIETARAAGATEMEEIYNTAWAAALGE